MDNKDYKEMAFITHATFGYEGLFIGFQRVVYHSGKYFTPSEAKKLCEKHGIRDINDLVGLPVKIRTIYSDGTRLGSPEHEILEIYGLEDD